MDGPRMHALACQYARSQTPEALEEALEACLPLCALIARRFSGKGAEYEDLYQTACLACVSALKGFDPQKGFQFSTYATASIAGAARNYLRDKAALLRAPRALRRQGAELAQAREDFYARCHQEPSPRQLAQALGWDLAQVLSVFMARDSSRVYSLEQQDEEGLSLGEKLPWLEKGFEDAERREDLRRALGALGEAERRLVRLRFIRRMSQRETAREMNMTQMQILRMERRALAALRKELTEQP